MNEKNDTQKSSRVSEQKFYLIWYDSCYFSEKDFLFIIHGMSEQEHESAHEKNESPLLLSL